MPRARSRLIASPSPVPSCGRVSPARTCTNGSNTAACCSTGIPTPVSATRSATVPAPASQVSRTRPPAEALAVADALGAELVPMGSAGAKAMAVVRGEAEIYLHTGGQHEWDSCAPVAVARAHGLHCSRVDGTPLVYNRADTAIPDLLICRPEWAMRVLAEVASSIV